MIDFHIGLSAQQLVAQQETHRLAQEAYERQQEANKRAQEAYEHQEKRNKLEQEQSKCNISSL